MPHNPTSKRISLVQKLVLTYAAIVFFCVAAAAFSLFGLYSLNTIVIDIAQKDFTFIKTTEELRTSILAQERSAAKYSVIKSPEFKKLFKLQQQEFLAHIAKLNATDPTPHLATLAKDYQLFSNEAETLFRDEATDLSNLKLSAQNANNTLEDLITSRQKLLNSKLINADHRREHTVTWTIVLSCSGFAFAMVVMILFYVTFSSSMHKLKRATHRIAEGDFDYDPKIAQGDEIGDLAKDFSKMAMRLKELEQLSLDASPLTRLPGNIAIERVITKLLHVGEPFAVCYADLDNFKAYNDHYGYIKGSDLIKMTGEVIYEAVQKHADANSFVGHIGGDDFVMIVDSAAAEIVCEEVITRITEKVPEFYAPEDLAAGFIEAVDRYGITRVFPLMTISIAVVICQQGEYDSAVKIARTAAEIKEYAKGAAGSNYFIDRRKSAR
jgi:diguanylate cyclase (GGDEF)-like protein